MSSLSKEDQETLRLLVQHVARAFYEPRFTIVLDQLVRHPVLKDDDLAGRMGLQLKELNKVMAVLENDKLVRIHRQNELKEGAQRSVGRQYFYIDYQHFCNVVKWRVAEMRRRIDTTLRNELDNKGYICPQCGKSYSPLEADKVMDFAMGAFICDVCKAELVDNENAESVRGSQDRMQRFNRQMRFIREGLRRTETMVLPAFDVAQWIKMNIIDAERARAAAQGGAGAGLKIAGASGEAKQEEAFGIVLSVDKDVAQQRLERDREAAAKRAQNILPAWHLKSTISGELTALGIKETARIEETASSSVTAAATLPNSNDTILRGLGRAAASAQLLSISAAAQRTEDVKPDVTQIREADYYDQYYASLEASAAPSAQVTPLTGDLGSDFGEEEEDIKPNIEYLDSLNEYRKRSRSAEDIGAGGPVKTPRMNGEHAPSPLSYANGPLHIEASVEFEADVTTMEAKGEPLEDPMVYEEYTAYYEVMTARS
ncbi:unnamed protein product [Somion occarium]|uniref:HTH TFE/IIEalpha-type domain-containing protein n=2 Tax=Somion occarium TaxID=3059160 RepID=A0ABP1CXZ9_9APHY